MNAAGLKTEDGRLEESLRGTEALVANGDDLTVRKLVRLLEAGALLGSLDLLLEVKSDVAKLLLDVTNDFTLGRGGEGVAALSKNLHEVVGKVTTSHVDTGNGVGKSETLVDGDNVGDTVTGVEDDTSGTTGGVQGQDSLDGDVESGGVEGLEDDLGHLLTVGLGVDGRLSEQDGVLLGGHTQLVVEGVVPDLLHVVPVGDNTVLDGVAEGKDTTLGLSLVTDVRVLLSHTNHDTIEWSEPVPLVEGADRCHLRAYLPMVTGATDNGSWRIALVLCRLLTGPQSPYRQVWAIRSLGSESGVDLRKTARGASSPAKPALHIPELEVGQSRYSLRFSSTPCPRCTF